MMTMTEIEKSWLAGIVDGEGSIGIYAHKGKYKDKIYTWYRPSITIGMADIWIVKKIKNMLNYGSFYLRTTRKYRIMTRNCGIYNIQDWNKAKEFCDLLMPYMQLKKSQALIISVAANDCKNKEKMAYFADLTQQLNQRNPLWETILMRN